jgi:hypothetical protein
LENIKINFFVSIISYIFAVKSKTKIKYTAQELVDFAEKESTIAASSGDKLPINSSEKYKIVDGLLKDTFDKVDELIIIGNEIEKLSEIEDYALSLGKKISIFNEDAIEKCDTLKNDNRVGFIYVNGASLYSQRPEFMNYLKKKFPNSTVALIVIDLLFGKSQVCLSDRTKERITVFSGAQNFDEAIDEYKKRVKFLKIRKYAETPQEKFIFFI